MPSQLSYHFKSALLLMCHSLSDFLMHNISRILLLGEFEKIAKYVDRYRLYVRLFVSLFVCQQTSSHNFDAMSSKFFTHIWNGNISIPSTFEGQRSNAKVKVTILVILVIVFCQ